MWLLGYPTEYHAQTLHERQTRRTRIAMCQPALTLDRLQHDVIQEILYATSPSELKRIARQAYVLSCVCTNLYFAVQTWAHPIAKRMLALRGPGPTMQWKLASSTLREPLQFLCREAKAVRLHVPVPYNFFDPRADYSDIWVYDSVADHVSFWAGFAAEEIDGRPWQAALLKNWMLSVRRKSKQILLYRHRLAPAVKASKLCVRVAALDRNGCKIDQPMLDPVVIDPAKPTDEFILGKYMHVREGDKLRLMNQRELQSLNLERDDGTFLLEVYIAEM